MCVCPCVLAKVPAAVVVLCDCTRRRHAGIGRNTQIKGAVIENNVSIGADVTIKNVHNVKEADRSETGGFIIQVKTQQEAWLPLRHFKRILQMMVLRCAMVPVVRSLNLCRRCGVAASPTALLRLNSTGVFVFSVKVLLMCRMASSWCSREPPFWMAHASDCAPEPR